LFSHKRETSEKQKVSPWNKVELLSVHNQETATHIIGKQAKTNPYVVQGRNV
jgi:hypothetical protein